jgi:hypothetical protein
MQFDTSFFYDGLHTLLLLLLPTNTCHLRDKNEINSGIQYFGMLLYFKTNAK